jgi:alcohol dehydrogenase (cytochrome c)
VNQPSADRLRARLKRLPLRPAAAAAVLAAAAASAALAAGPGPAPAGQGRDLFAARCAACHGADLAGGEFGPPLSGAAFAGRWDDQPAGALASFISSRMPPSAPGTVSPAAAAELEAYIRHPGAAGALAAAAPAPAQAAAPASGMQTAPAPGTDRDPGLASAKAARLAPLARLTPVTDAMLRRPPDGEWLMWRRTYKTQGFSPLRQIDKANVKGLTAAWSWSLPPSQNEITPLVHDGVMFVQSGDTVQALAAAGGDLLWQYARTPPEGGTDPSGTRVKTMAIWRDRLFAAFVDGHVVALDVKTGKPVWDHQVIADADATNKGRADGVSFHLDGGPIVAKDKLVFGVSLGTDTARGGCYIVALNARDGSEVWRFHTVAQPGEPGGDTWNGAPADQRFGAGVWTPGSYDPDLNLVYLGVGNTYDAATLLQPRDGKLGPNDALYTDSTLALDADTGRLAWHFQHVRRDVWDLDWVFEQTLLDLDIGGRPRKLVLTGGKIALFDAMDRATGKYAFSRDMGLQNLVLGVDPKTGEKRLNPALEPEPGKPKRMCPSPLGARNWPATAVDPRSGVLFVPMIEFCTDYTWNPRSPEQTAKGGVDINFSGLLPRAGADGKSSRLAAVDLKTGRTVWMRRQRAPVASAMLVTAGGLVFTGDRDRYFRALDEATGKVLWQTRLNAAPSAFPITFTAGGRQYVAITTGGGNSWDGATAVGGAEIINPAEGDTLWVFSLPSGRR